MGKKKKEKERDKRIYRALICDKYKRKRQTETEPMEIAIILLKRQQFNL